MTNIDADWTDDGARVMSSIAIACPRCATTVTPNVEHLCGDRVPKPEPTVAVLCGNLEQFEAFARKNPEIVGRKVGRHRYERAYPVTRLFHIVGRRATEVYRIGSWVQLPNIEAIWEAVRLAQLAPECRGVKGTE